MDAEAQHAAEDIAQIRDARAARLCAKFPGEYWAGARPAERAYPTEFVAAFDARRAFSPPLIPEGAWAGSGLSMTAGPPAIMGGDPRVPAATGAALPRPDVHHGDPAAARQRGARRRAGFRRSRPASFACRPLA